MKNYHALLVSLGIICGCSFNHSVSSTEASQSQSQTPKIQQGLQKNGSPASNANSSIQQFAEEPSANQDNKSSQQNRSNSKQSPNRYEIAGIQDAKAFERFFTNLQKDVEQSNKQKVANAVRYPINVILDGKKTSITSTDSFIQHYNQIITRQVKMAIINQRIEEAFVRDQGVMVGQGEMWLGVSNNDPLKFYIIAINNDIH